MKKSRYLIVIIGLLLVAGGIIFAVLHEKNHVEEEPITTYEELAPNMHNLNRIEVEGIDEVHEVLDELLEGYSCVWLRRLPNRGEGANEYMITYSNCPNDHENCPYQAGMGCAAEQCAEDNVGDCEGDE